MIVAEVLAGLASPAAGGVAGDGRVALSKEALLSNGHLQVHSPETSEQDLQAIRYSSRRCPESPSHPCQIPTGVQLHLTHPLTYVAAYEPALAPGSRAACPQMLKGGVVKTTASTTYTI